LLTVPDDSVKFPQPTAEPFAVTKRRVPPFTISAFAPAEMLPLPPATDRVPELTVIAPLVRVFDPTAKFGPPLLSVIAPKVDEAFRFIVAAVVNDTAGLYAIFPTAIVLVPQAMPVPLNVNVPPDPCSAKAPPLESSANVPLFVTVFPLFTFSVTAPGAMLLSSVSLPVIVTAPTVDVPVHRTSLPEIVTVSRVFPFG
jgi:hypothetical protein